MPSVKHTRVCIPFTSVIARHLCHSLKVSIRDVQQFITTYSQKHVLIEIKLNLHKCICREATIIFFYLPSLKKKTHQNTKKTPTKQNKKPIPNPSNKIISCLYTNNKCSLTTFISVCN